MGIFKSLSDILADGQQLVLTVRKSGSELVVSVMPDTSGVKDKAVENIVPIVLNGTPEEFEEGFIDALRNGLPQVTGLVSNIKEYEESVELAKKATEMAKKEKDEKAKNKKEFDGYIELARQNVRENKFVDAKKCLDKAAAVKDADKMVIDKARKYIAEKSGEGGLFQGPVDMSDGKNITLGKNATVPTPATKPAQTSDAFKEAMELDDNDENNDENENQEEE
jgi:PRTRC genetic system protein E